MEDVATRAEVAVPTVYKTFTNKRNLLKAAATAMTGGPADLLTGKPGSRNSSTRPPPSCNST